MSKQFLGKQIPESTSLPPATKRVSKTGLFLMLLGLGCCALGAQLLRPQAPAVTILPPDLAPDYTPIAQTVLAEEPPAPSSVALAAVPDAPVVKATATSTSVTLTWSKVTGTNSYNVYYGQDAGNEQILTILGANVTSWTDSTRLPGHTYYYQVGSLRNSGTVAVSDEVSISTPFDVTISGLKGSNSGGGLLLTWNAINGATGYNIYRSGTKGTTGGFPIAHADAATYTDTSVATNTTYYYRISAVFPNGESTPSGETAITSTAAGNGGSGSGSGDGGTTAKDIPMCDWDNNHDLQAAFSPNTIFPILPSAVLDGTSPTNCSPSFWNLTIVQILIFKALGLLNYIVFVAGILLLVYAGVLYISGFANEGNVKTARTIIVATFTGMIIALSARLIIGAALGIFGTPGQSITDVINTTFLK